MPSQSIKCVWGRGWRAGGSQRLAWLSPFGPRSDVGAHSAAIVGALDRLAPEFGFDLSLFVDARNRADSMVYQVEKMLKDHRDKISDADAKNVEEALSGARKAMEGGGVEEMNKAIDNLTQASHKLAEAMYKTSSSQAGRTASASAGWGGSRSGRRRRGRGRKKDDVVDAEFVDVEDKKK